MKSLNNLSQIQYEQANERLTGYYKKWYKEIKEKTDLVGDKYSNPYYIDIPHNWFETKLPRILIVGEEGYGTYGAGKTDDIRGDAIEEIQEITGGYVAQQTGQEGGDGSKVNTSPFWKRFRGIA